VSVLWDKKDELYFRKLGIGENPKPDEPPPPTSWPLFLLLSLLAGMAFYGLLQLAAWALRALGVNVTSVP
jgi:hypothetical protein